MANVLHTDSISSTSLFAVNANLPSPAITTTQQRVMLVMVLNIGSTSGNFPPDIGSITGGGLTWTQATLQHELQSTKTAEILMFYTITNKLLSGQVFQVGTQNAQANSYTMAIAQVTGWQEGVGSPFFTLDAVMNYFNASVPTAADVGTVAPPYTVNLRFGSTAWCQGAGTPTFNATGWTSMFTPNGSFAQSTMGYIISSSTTGYKAGGNANAWVAADLSFKMAAVYGAITTNLTNLSMSASGTSGPSGESGTIATHLSGITMSLSGTISPAGTIQTHLTRLAMSASGNVSQEFGTISTHLLGLSQSANGAVASNVGHIVTALPAMSQLAQGEQIITGDVATHLDNAFGMQAQGSALEEFIATITTNLPGISVSAEAEEIFVADATTNLFPISQALTGDVFIEGSVLTALGRAGQFMTTFVEALEIIEGPIVTNLSGVETHALGGLMGSPGTGKFYSWRSPDS